MSFLRWLPATALALVIFYFSHLRRPPGVDLAPDYVAHFLEYGIFALTLLWGFNPYFRRPVTFQMALAACLIAAFYGVLDEVHQSFIPGRDASLADVMADLLGSVISVGGVFLIRRG